MNIATKLRMSAIPFALLVSLSASAQVKNPGFEVGGAGIQPPGWDNVGGVLQGPPEGAGLGGPGSNSAVFHLGTGDGLVGGFRGAGICQPFKCGQPDDTKQCFVRFAYVFNDGTANGNARAFVAMDGPKGLYLTMLPDNVPPGPQRVQVTYPCCGPLRLYFGLVEPTATTTFQSVFAVDQIEDKCGIVGFPGTPTLAMPPYDSSPNDPVSVLVNELCDQLPWLDMGSAKPASNGERPWLLGSGDLTAGSVNSLHVANATSTSLTVLFIGGSVADVNFAGGTLVPTPDLVAVMGTNADGTIDLPFSLPASTLPGLTSYSQAWILNPINGTVSATNGLRAVVQ